MATSCSRWSEKARGAGQPCGTREVVPQGCLSTACISIQSLVCHLRMCTNRTRISQAAAQSLRRSPQRSVVTTFEPASALTSIVGPIPAVSSDMSPMYCAAAPA